MQKIIIILTGILVMLPVSGYCWNPFKGIIEAKIADEFTALKQEFQGDLTGVKGDLSAVKGDITGIKGNLSNVMQMYNALNAKIDAQMAIQVGFNNTISKSVSEMKVTGNNNNINDIKIYELEKEKYIIQMKAEAQNTQTWKYLFGAILSLLCIQSARLFWIQKFTLKDAQANSRYFMTELAKRSTNGDFDRIMKDKRDYDQQRGTIAQTFATISKVKSYITQPKRDKDRKE